MVISGQYLTYNEYKSLGGTNDQMSFSLAEYEARKNIDRETFNRLVNLDTQDDEVKLCVYNLINVITTNGAYIDGNEDAKQQIITRNIRNYLANYKINDVPVLYAGVDNAIR